MQINLTPRSKLFVDGAGAKSLAEEQLSLLSNGLTSVSGVAVSGETLSTTCWLGARYNLDEINYYFSSAGEEEITIKGKQAPDDVWTILSQGETTSPINIDLENSINKYQYINLTHEVSTGAATSFELEIKTSDDEVLFGGEGQTTKFGVDSGTNTLVPEPIPVYNNSVVEQDFYCLLDAEDPQSENTFLGGTLSGPFSSLYETGISIPDDFSWSSGVFETTQEVDNTVVLVSGTFGVYYTPVIDLDGVDGRRLFWKATLSGTNEIDISSSEDNNPTISIRLSNIAPVDSWSNGEISNDEMWSVVSGTLEFVPYVNNTILDPRYRRYCQAKIEFHSPQDGQTPVLEKVGVEEGLKITIPSKESRDIYVKSGFSDHVQGRDTFLLAWYFESRNE